MPETQEISTEVEAGAVSLAPTRVESPRQLLAKAITQTLPSVLLPSSTPIPQANGYAQTISRPPADTELSGQLCDGNQIYFAAQPHSVGLGHAESHIHFADRTELPGQSQGATHSSVARQHPTDCGHPVSANHPLCAAAGTPLADQGQCFRADHLGTALVGEITAIYRRYEDLRRARQRIELQAIATCRNVCGGDKIEGMKLYKSPTPQVEVWLTPYRLAMQPLDAAIKEQEKLLTKLGKALPVREWADTVPGLSPRFLAAIIGECGIGPGEFRSVSALWKRMGIAVIGGGRQRRVTGDAALEHGYVPRRRALMWNIGDQVAVRHGVRNPKDEEGKPTGATAINEWGALYLERKAYELAREIDGKALSPMHAHNRAKRYVEKRLLRELWRAWRRASNRVETERLAPAA